MVAHTNENQRVSKAERRLSEKSSARHDAMAHWVAALVDHRMKRQRGWIRRMIEKRLDRETELLAQVFRIAKDIEVPEKDIEVPEKDTVVPADEWHSSNIQSFKRRKTVGRSIHDTVSLPEAQPQLVSISPQVREILRMGLESGTSHDQSTGVPPKEYFVRSRSLELCVNGKPFRSARVLLLDSTGDADKDARQTPSAEFSGMRLAVSGQLAPLELLKCPTFVECLVHFMSRIARFEKSHTPERLVAENGADLFLAYLRANGGSDRGLLLHATFSTPDCLAGYVALDEVTGCDFRTLTDTLRQLAVYSKHCKLTRLVVDLVVLGNDFPSKIHAAFGERIEPIAEPQLPGVRSLKVAFKNQVIDNVDCVIHLCNLKSIASSFREVEVQSAASYFTDWTPGWLIPVTLMEGRACHYDLWPSKEELLDRSTASLLSIVIDYLAALRSSIGVVELDARFCRRYDSLRPISRLKTSIAE